MTDYLRKIERVLDVARAHKDAGTDIPPGEIFAAAYLSDRKANEADIRRGQEIWESIHAGIREATDQGQTNDTNRNTR